MYGMEGYPSMIHHWRHQAHIVVGARDVTTGIAPACAHDVQYFVGYGDGWSYRTCCKHEQAAPVIALKL
jgi:hypothetical protein